MAPDVKERLIAHLAEFFPGHARVLGREGLERAVALTGKKAAARGFTGERQLVLYADVVFFLGSGFAEDIQYPWAAETLADPALYDPSERITALYRRAVRFLDQASGPRHEHALRALSRVQHEGFRMPAERKIDLDEYIVGRLNQIYPEKTAAVGLPRIRLMVEDAAVAAERHGLPAGQGQMTYAGLMLALGSSFDGDPLFPWAQAVFEDRSLARPEDKLRKLEGEAAVYARRRVS